MSRAVVRRLRCLLPGVGIDIWGRPAVQAVFDDLCEEDKGIAFHPLPLKGGTQSMVRAWAAIRRTSPRAVLLLAPSMRAAIEFWGAGTPFRFGFPDDCRRFLLTHVCFRKGPPSPGARRVPFRRHVVEEWVSLADCLARHFGVSPPVPEPPAIDGRFFDPHGVRRMEAERLRCALGGRKDLIAVAVFPLTRGGQTRSWPLDRFFQVMDVLHRKRDVELFVFAASENCTELEALRGMDRERFHLFAGRHALSLGELIALAPAFRVALTHDSGPMHLMGAVGVPQVALFGSTLPALTGPYWGRVRILHDAPEACAGCYARTCRKGVRCLKNISVECVLEALDALLDAPCESW